MTVRRIEVPLRQIQTHGKGADDLLRQNLASIDMVTKEFAEAR